MDEPIRAFIGFLRTEQRASPETLRNYASDLRQLHRFLLSRRLLSSPIDPNSLSSDALRAYLQWLDQKGGKPSSLARKLAAVRSFYRYLSRRGMVSRNPVDGMRTPKQPKLLPRVLTKDDADALMTFPAGQTVWSLRDRALLETLYSTGARVSELVALDIGDVSEPEGLVRLQGKGRKERIVPIGEMALDAIRRYRVSLPLQSSGVPPGVVLQPARREADQPECGSHRDQVFEPARGRSGQPSHAASFLCHASARRGRRPSEHSGDVGTCVAQHDATVHTRGHRSAVGRV